MSNLKRAALDDDAFLAALVEIAHKAGPMQPRAQPPLTLLEQLQRDGLPRQRIGQGQAARPAERSTRVPFYDMASALHLLGVLADSPFAVQFTTYPPPRIRDTSGNEGPLATLDFVSEMWLIDAVSLLRDICRDRYPMLDDARHPRDVSEGSKRGVLWGVQLTPAGGARVLRLLLEQEHQHEAIEACWRIGGRQAMAGVIREVLLRAGEALDGKMRGVEYL